MESNHVQSRRGDGGLITLRTPQQTIFATSTHKDKDVYTTSEYPQTESFVRMLRNSAIAKKLRDILTQAVVINRHRISLIIFPDEIRGRAVSLQQMSFLLRVFCCGCHKKYGTGQQ